MAILKSIKTELLRLGSVTPYGVGGPKAAAINLIYSILLQLQKIDFYNFILINQIDHSLNEFILIKRNEDVFINIQYHTDEDYYRKSISERNNIRLHIIHEALLRLTLKDSRLKENVLNEIKEKIIRKDFLFDFVIKYLENEYDKKVVAKLIVSPLEDRFNFHVLVEENGTEKSRYLIYVGKTLDSYINNFFNKLVWISKEELLISDKQRQFEIHINLLECKIAFINLTAYDKVPIFEMMRADISAQENDTSYRNWLHSLPPAFSAIISRSEN
jgi:hypothetical protein